MVEISIYLCKVTDLQTYSVIDWCKRREGGRGGREREKESEGGERRGVICSF